MNIGTDLRFSQGRGTQIRKFRKSPTINKLCNYILFNIYFTTGAVVQFYIQLVHIPKWLTKSS